MTKSTTKTKGAAAEGDPFKDAANAIVDAMVASNGERTLQFAAQLAAERARGHAIGAFPLRSMNNRLYLEAQARARREDTKFLFAGSAQWQKMGRRVVEGEKSYKIYGCNFYDKKEKDSNTGQETTTRVYRRSSPILEVFDWTQTVSTVDGYVEPDWDTPLAAGDNTTLMALADSLDIPVTFTDLSAKNYHGKYDGNAITIDSEAAVGNQIIELARQAAHHVLGHPVSTTARLPKGYKAQTEEYTATYVAEQEAALTGWLVARGLGLDETVGNDVTAQCAEYLVRWTKFDKEGAPMDLAGIKSRRKLVLERLNVAVKAADTILGAYCRHDVETTAPAPVLV